MAHGVLHTTGCVEPRRFPKQKSQRGDEKRQKRLENCGVIEPEWRDPQRTSRAQDTLSILTAASFLREE